ncbi:MAG TPA: hypothetical protein VGO92_03060 [Acidimicrobiales bacterium]|jgi:hypothetical protein|nr:hypothetical protein [Acidimicrobiales bacterium]
MQGRIGRVAVLLVLLTSACSNSAGQHGVITTTSTSRPPDSPAFETAALERVGHLQGIHLLAEGSREKANAEQLALDAFKHWEAQTALRTPHAYGGTWTGKAGTDPPVPVWVVVADGIGPRGFLSRDAAVVSARDGTTLDMFGLPVAL